jgi:hypothetical protein
LGEGNKSFLAQAWFGLCLLQLSVVSISFIFFLFKLGCRHGRLAEGRNRKKGMEVTYFQELAI